jgi:hypothetical protein
MHLCRSSEAAQGRGYCDGGSAKKAVANPSGVTAELVVTTDKTCNLRRAARVLGA